MRSSVLSLGPNGIAGILLLDIETPPPADILREGTAQEGTHDARQREDTTKGSEDDRALLQRGYSGHDGQGGNEDTRSSDTRKGTTENQNIDTGRDYTFPVSTTGPLICLKALQTHLRK